MLSSSCVALLTLAAWQGPWAALGTRPSVGTMSAPSAKTILVASKVFNGIALQSAATPWVKVSLSPVDVGIQMLERNNLYGGIAVTLGCAPGPTTSLYPNAGQGIVTSLRKAFAPLGPPEVRLTGRLVNVTPEGGIPALLRTRIGQFDYAEGRLISPPLDLMPEFIVAESNRAELTPKMAILSLPEIRDAARSHGIKAAPLSGFGGVSTGVHFTIHERNTTVVDLLNRVVTIAGRGVWVYEQWDCTGHKTYRLDLIGI